MSKRKAPQKKTRINEAIRARELRIIDDEKGNLGTMSAAEALKLAQEAGLDLIEISPDAKPPVAKIMDYGKWNYDQKRKDRDVRAKTKAARVEVKEVQIKPGTGENDLQMKARRGSKWLEEGHRLKVEIFLRGREKYMDKKFHQARIDNFLKFLSVPYTVVDLMKKVPKGQALIVEKDKSKKTAEPRPQPVEEEKETKQTPVEEK